MEGVPRHGGHLRHPASPGLKESDRLPQPIFTPATKAQSGHDENIPFSEFEKIAGRALAETLRDLTLEIYSTASRYAESRGIILADTKFEFGHIGGRLVLADEVLTPDSSRFWPRDSYSPGGPQKATTSNSSATTSRPSTGTSVRPPRRFLPKWPPAPARNISKPTAFLRAGHYELA